jgi:hypothetical protein
MLLDSVIDRERERERANKILVLGVLSFELS